MISNYNRNPNRNSKHKLTLKGKDNAPGFLRKPKTAKKSTRPSLFGRAGAI